MQPYWQNFPYAFLAIIGGGLLGIAIIVDLIWGDLIRLVIKYELSDAEGKKKLLEIARAVYEEQQKQKSQGPK